MKFFPSWLAVLALTLFASPGYASKFVKETKVPLTKAYVPHGFDSDDSIEIVVTGTLPSTCYKLGPLDTLVDDKNHAFVSLTAYQFSGDCLDGPIPFSQVVYLGRLRVAGDYDIVDGTSQETIGKLNVTKAPALGHGTDEVLYAPLADAFLLQGKDRNVIRLVGAFPDSCLSIRKTTILLEEDVMVVLPELKRDGADCEKGHYPFQVDVKVERELPHRTFLLHVRSMSGTSINKLVVSHP